MNVDSALFGFAAGVLLNVCTRAATYEPLAARPWSYLATGTFLGFSIWYYDYWRRRAIEEILYAEERRRYNRKSKFTLTCLEQLKAINRVRIGEENEVTNLIEYLTNSTVRE